MPHRRKGNTTTEEHRCRSLVSLSHLHGVLLLYSDGKRVRMLVASCSEFGFLRHHVVGPVCPMLSRRALERYLQWLLYRACCMWWCLAGQEGVRFRGIVPCGNCICECSCQEASITTNTMKQLLLEAGTARSFCSGLDLTTMTVTDVYQLSSNIRMPGQSRNSN